MQVRETEAKALQGQPVLSAEGEKIGEVEAVLYDKATGKPEWLSVQRGLLGRDRRILPFRNAERGGDGIRTPYSAAQVEAAPAFEGTEISQTFERRLASHYGVQYSEARSPTGLAGGTRKSQRRQSTRKRRQPTGRSRSKSSSPRRSSEPTRAELYEEAKRRGIEGRSTMNKAQLERALGRRSGQSRGRGKANPFEVQSFLEAVGYPASKLQLVRKAKAQGADAKVRSTLEQLPDEQFSTAADVNKAIAKIS
jgi:Protein of unknown function (DUF2795)/PRC-barrel domain